MRLQANDIAVLLDSCQYQLSVCVLGLDIPSVAVRFTWVSSVFQKVLVQGWLVEATGVLACTSQMLEAYYREEKNRDPTHH